MNYAPKVQCPHEGCTEAVRHWHLSPGVGGYVCNGRGCDLPPYCYEPRTQPTGPEAPTEREWRPITREQIREAMHGL